MKIKRHAFNFIGIFLLIAGIFYSCEIQENFKYQPSESDGKLGMSAWEFIQQRDSFSFMESAIEFTGLKAMYDEGSDRTFILPKNVAFRKYMAENGYPEIEDIPRPILSNILKYHVVKSSVIFTDPELATSNYPISYPTENGQIMFLSHKTNFVGLINEGTSKQWEIVTSNLEPANGVIHVVNSITYYSVATGDTDSPSPDLVTDTIYPLHDTYINGGSKSTENFGKDPLLKIKNVTGDGNYDRKAFLMFDFSGFSKAGVITDVRFETAIKFTHGKGVNLNLFETPDTNWSELSLNFDNAVFPEDEPIASIITSKVSSFEFDITDFFKSKDHKGRVSLMLDGEPGSDETDELASKEHPDLFTPRMIATIASGNSSLELVAKEDLSVNNGGVFVLQNENLSVEGAPTDDIIYTVEAAPEMGWLIKGANVLQADSKFTQSDIDLNNLLYIHNGMDTGSDEFILSVRDRAGAFLDDIVVKINIR
ncbi:DNRLRE domain-containing protein [Membranicola marinus]|uniref:DNRLRE domain-containing protein n=1 Tax=Membranihabitans marinus TaxID=1227546 RepID=A0A953HRV8_9BACT|nr:DNRLRE domain-containing protein [Membranihabitans marinus]MBY5956763.1 DNRLRE domain-containing protein [Membranihabitans marinus]